MNNKKKNVLLTKKKGAFLRGPIVQVLNVHFEGPHIFIHNRAFIFIIYLICSFKETFKLGVSICACGVQTRKIKLNYFYVN